MDDHPRGATLDTVAVAPQEIPFFVETDPQPATVDLESALQMIVGAVQGEVVAQSQQRCNEMKKEVVSWADLQFQNMLAKLSERVSSLEKQLDDMRQKVETQDRALESMNRTSDQSLAALRSEVQRQSDAMTKQLHELPRLKMTVDGHARELAAVKAAAAEANHRFAAEPQRSPPQPSRFARLLGRRNVSPA